MCGEARKWCNEPEGAMKRCVYRVYRGSEIVKSMQRNSEIVKQDLCKVSRERSEHVR